MANQIVQYGATVAVGVGVAGLAAGVTAGAARGAWLAQNLDYASPAAQAAAVSSGAIDAGVSAAGSAIGGIISNPAFLTSIGVGLAGLALGSGAVKVALSFPNLAGTAAVALSVGSLLQQGKAAAASFAQAKSGINIGSTVGPPVALRTGTIPDDAIDTARRTRITSTLKYPLDLSSEYFIRFSLARYTRFIPGEAANMSIDPHTTVRLPVPSSLIDSINLAYQDVGLGQFGGAAYGEIMNKYNSSGESSEIVRMGQAAVGGMANAINSPGFMQALSRRLAASLDPGLGAMFDLATGTAPNPHATVSFQGVSLKKYNFVWKMSPNSLEESKMLHDIVRNLQASSLPTVQNKFMLGFPDIVKVELFPTNLFIFKPMFIDNVVINYTPSGTPSFYKANGNTSAERYPTEIELMVSLREVEIHTASDEEYARVRDQQNNRLTM